MERPDPPPHHCHQATHPPVCTIAGDGRPPLSETALTISAVTEQVGPSQTLLRVIAGRTAVVAGGYEGTTDSGHFDQAVASWLWNRRSKRKAS
jgi:hypothetical protein